MKYFLPALAIIVCVLAFSLALFSAANASTTVLPVFGGGTATSSFGQGWVFSSGGTGYLAASTSPTVNYITATSTTATSTFADGIALTKGCFAMPNGACLSSGGGGSGTVTSVAAGSGLNGGTFTTSGTLSLGSYFATSTPDTTGYLVYSATTNGWPAKFAYVATSTLTAGTGLTGSFTQIGSGGSIALSVPVAVSNGGTGSSNIGVSQLLSTNASGNIVSTSTPTAAVFNGTSTTATSNFVSASTTNLTASTYFSVNGNNITGYRYLTWLFPATTTAWTGTGTVDVIAPFTGTMVDTQCNTATSSTDTIGTYTLQTLIKDKSTIMVPELNASTTQGNVTFTSNNAFSKGDMLEMDAGNPANSPIQMTCTSRATGA